MVVAGYAAVLHVGAALVLACKICPLVPAAVVAIADALVAYTMPSVVNPEKLEFGLVQDKVGVVVPLVVNTYPMVPPSKGNVAL